MQSYTSQFPFSTYFSNLIRLLPWITYSASSPAHHSPRGQDRHCIFAQPCIPSFFTAEENSTSLHPAAQALDSRVTFATSPFLNDHIYSAIESCQVTSLNAYAFFSCWCSLQFSLVSGSPHSSQGL